MIIHTLFLFIFLFIFLVHFSCSFCSILYILTHGINQYICPEHKLLTQSHWMIYERTNHNTPNFLTDFARPETDRPEHQTKAETWDIFSQLAWLYLPTTLLLIIVDSLDEMQITRHHSHSVVMNCTQL